MSSILKALRRLEEERARKNSVAPEIAANLLRSGVRRRQFPLWIWPTVIAVVAVAIAVASLFWSLRPAPVQIDSARQTLAPLSSSVNNASNSSARRSGGVIIEEVIDQRRPVLLPSAPPALSTPVFLPTVVEPVPQRIEPKVTTPVETNKLTLPLIQGRHTPVISAIAWQEESSARMAVVDGLPVMTGETIGTVRIHEIQRDRIIFESEGIRFTVRIDSP